MRQTEISAAIQYRWHQKSETVRRLISKILQNILKNITFVLNSLQKSITLKKIFPKKFYLFARCIFPGLNAASVNSNWKPPGRSRPLEFLLSSRRGDAAGNSYDPGRPKTFCSIALAISHNPAFCTHRYLNSWPFLLERIVLIPPKHQVYIFFSSSKLGKVFLSMWLSRPRFL
jgi:hypothetical protein